MKTKFYFIADLCIRVSTYRKPSISNKELELLEEYVKDLDGGVLTPAESEYLLEEAKQALKCFKEDKKLIDLNERALKAEAIIKDLIEKVE